MFEKEQHIVDATGLAISDQRALQRQRLRVGHDAKLADFNRSHQASTGSQLSMALFT